MDERISEPATSTSLARSSKEVYVLSCRRVARLVGLSAWVSLVRFTDGSPEEDRSDEGLIGWLRIDGWVS
jgi:hypothetical protein